VLIVLWIYLLPPVQVKAFAIEVMQLSVIDKMLRARVIRGLLNPSGKTARDGCLIRVRQQLDLHPRGAFNSTALP